MLPALKRLLKILPVAVALSGLPPFSAGVLPAQEAPTGGLPGYAGSFPTISNPVMRTIF